MAQDISQQHDTTAKKLSFFLSFSSPFPSCEFPVSFRPFASSMVFIFTYTLFLFPFSSSFFFFLFFPFPHFFFHSSLLLFFFFPPLFRLLSSSYASLCYFVRSKTLRETHKTENSAYGFVREFENRGHTQTHTHGTKTAFDPETTLIVNTPFVLPTSYLHIHPLSFFLFYFNPRFEKNTTIW